MKECGIFCPLAFPTPLAKHWMPTIFFKNPLKLSQFLLLWAPQINFPKLFDVFSFLQWLHLLSQLPAQRSQKRQFSSWGWNGWDRNTNTNGWDGNTNTNGLDGAREIQNSPHSWIVSLDHFIEMTRYRSFQLWTGLVKLKIGKNCETLFGRFFVT